MFPFADADVHHRSFPIANVFLIALNTLVFLYELQLGGFGFLTGGGNLDISAFFFKWGFIPQELTTGRDLTYLRAGFNLVDIETPLPAWATLFSSMFVHGGFLHFAGNMMFLWVFGDNVEDRLGHVKYLIFYLLAGVAAALSQLAIDFHSQAPLIGASGAISGVMGAYLVLYPYNRIKALVVYFFITVVQLPAMYFLGFWLILQLINGLGALGISQQVNVAFFAHIGGFVAGVVLIAAYLSLTGQHVWPPRRPRAYWWRPE